MTFCKNVNWLSCCEIHPMAEVISCGSIIEQRLIRIFFAKVQNILDNFTSWCQICGAINKVSEILSSNIYVYVLQRFRWPTYHNEDSRLFFLLIHIRIYGAAVQPTVSKSPSTSSKGMWWNRTLFCTHWSAVERALCTGDFLSTAAN